MKKLAFSLALVAVAALSACSKSDKPAPAAAKPAAPAVKTITAAPKASFTPVYVEPATRSAASAFEAAVKGMATPGPSDPAAPLSAEEKVAFERYEKARADLMGGLSDPRAQGAAMHEVMVRALAGMSKEGRAAFQQRLERANRAQMASRAVAAASAARTAPARRPGASAAR